MVDDGLGIFLQSKKMREGSVSVPQDRNGGRTNGRTPPDPAWMYLGSVVGVHFTTVKGPMDVPGLLTKESGVSGITSRGLQGGGCIQPPDSLRTPSCVG